MRECSNDLSFLRLQNDFSRYYKSPGQYAHCCDTRTWRGQIGDKSDGGRRVDLSSSASSGLLYNPVACMIMALSWLETLIDY